MDVRSQKVNTFIIFLAFHLSLVASTNTIWVGSKYQIECTMCAACDNPCNQQSPTPPPPPPSPPLCPPPPSTTGNYYYSPPPPSTTGYYYSPPPPSQNVYYNYPPQSPNRNYPTPGPPNPIMGYYPYYHYNPPSYSAAGVSLSGATTLMLLIINIFFICLFF